MGPSSAVNPSPVTLRVVEIEIFEQLQRLEVRQSRIRDACGIQLQEIELLQALQVSQTCISNGGIREVEHCAVTQRPR